MSRLAARFAELRKQGRAAFVPFVTAGDPDLDTSFAILEKLPAAGADVIELGMPFTDPMADGPAVQASSLRALKAGTTLARVIELVKKFRKADARTPVVLMGYYNPVHAYGTARFIRDAAAAGVDGLIIVDLPPEEDEVLRTPAKSQGVDLIRLVTPTTDAARLAKVLPGASGYLYYVSVTGVTGTKSFAEDQVAAALQRIRAASDLPVAVGFGIRTPEQAAAIARIADGVVVGSAIVSRIADAPKDKAAAEVLELCRDLAGSHARRQKWYGAGMNWITNIVRPRIKSLMGGGKGRDGGRGNDTPENLWRKCSACGEMIFYRDLEANLNVCPQCGHHMRIGPAERFAYTFDSNQFSELTPPTVTSDPLRFKGDKKYVDEIKAAKAKTGRPEALTAARGTLDGLPVLIAVQPFDFLGGSLGMGVGEGLVQAFEVAIAEKRPFILYVASGGARMQEGVLSLMQLPRVTIMVDMLREAGLPYIVVLTDPTFGGVSASYAMLGDVQIAEPGAQIGFTGARVIAQTIREKLPEGFQRAEYLLAHGMLDMVVHRAEMRATLSRTVHMLMKKPRPKTRSLPSLIDGKPRNANGNGHAITK